MGADLAVQHDKTVIYCLMLGEGGGPHQMVARGVLSRTNWEAVYDAIAAMSSTYGKCPVLIDSTAAGAQLEALQNRGVNADGYNFAGGEKKVQLVLTAQEAIQNQSVKFPHIPELVNELILYDWKDKNLQTDNVFGLCLALEAARRATTVAGGISVTDTGIYVVRTDIHGSYIAGDGIRRIDDDDDDISSLAAALAL
jgi:hypothetical protein